MNDINNLNNLNINNNNNFNNLNINSISNINNINNALINQTNPFLVLNSIRFISNTNSQNNSEEKNSGKYICKYQILIKNDSEFQIASWLICIKCCNMNKIINKYK